ncbi:ATP-binding protein [Thermoleptolyngbya sp.]
MKSPRSSEASLYELALSSEHPLHPLQVSPTTFKSMLTAVLDLLIEERLPATLWLKFPRGETWESEITRYCTAATAPYTLYTLGNSQGDLAEASTPSSSGPLPYLDQVSDLTAAEMAGLVEGPAVDSLVLTHPPQPTSLSVAAQSQRIALPLGAESQFKREYLLLVMTEEFCGLILAHRPRSVRSPKPDSSPPERPLWLEELSPGSDEDVERRHPLLAIYTLESDTIRRVLEGIQQAIAPAAAPDAVRADLEALVTHWNEWVLPAADRAPNPRVVGQLLAKQLQIQEEMWHSTAIYRRQAETAAVLQMENEELQNAIRLKDEFLKTVGQELRTPLATMKTALSLLNSPSLKPPQRQRYMDMLTHECDRQSSLITSVLELVQLENMDDTAVTQPLRLSDVVPGIVSTYQPLAQEKGILLAYTVPQDLPAVSCTVPWLRQILINLLHNGIKFTPKGGRVWVLAKLQGDYVQIEVRDTGIGIAAADIPKIFDRFYRVRQAGSGEDPGGAGLGLSIVQQLLLKCGGSISVKSKPGEGSTFNVMLPVYR